MIEVSLSYQYTAHHRYDSDLDEKVEQLVSRLLGEIGGEDTGSGGGCGLGMSPNDMAADNAFYMKVPDLESAGAIRLAVNELLATYDPRYSAKVREMKD